MIMFYIGVVISLVAIYAVNDASKTLKFATQALKSATEKEKHVTEMLHQWIEIAEKMGIEVKNQKMARTSEGS